MGKHKSILIEADEIVNGSRSTDYGDSTKNAQKIARLTGEMLTKEEWALLSQGIVPPSMAFKTLMAVKLTRQAHAPKRDNLVDLAGYAELLQRMETP